MVSFFKPEPAGRAGRRNRSRQATRVGERARTIVAAQSPEIAKKTGFSEEEARLVQAIAEADLRNFSAVKRIRLRLQLAEAQRMQAVNLTRDPALPGDEHWLRVSEATVRQAIALAAQTKNVGAYLEGLDQLAGIFATAGNWAAAEATLREALKLEKDDPRPDHRRSAQRFQYIAVACQQSGKPREAADSLEEALGRYDEVLDPDQIEMADCLSAAGRLFRALGELERAEDCLAEAHRVHRKRLGAEHQQTLSDLQQLAGVLDEAGDPEAAAAAYEQILSIQQRQLGVENLDQVGNLQFSLANLHTGWGNTGRARELLAEAIGAFKRAGGPRLAVAHEALAQVEESSGRYLNALRELEAAGKAWERAGRIQELVNNLRYRADLCDELRKTREANWLREQAREKLGEAPGGALGQFS